MSERPRFTRPRTASDGRRAGSSQAAGARGRRARHRARRRGRAGADDHRRRPDRPASAPDDEDHRHPDRPGGRAAHRRDRPAAAESLSLPALRRRRARHDRPRRLVRVRGARAGSQHALPRRRAGRAGCPHRRGLRHGRAARHRALAQARARPRAAVAQRPSFRPLPLAPRARVLVRAPPRHERVQAGRADACARAASRHDHRVGHDRAAGTALCLPRLPGAVRPEGHRAAAAGGAALSAQDVQARQAAQRPGVRCRRARGARVPGEGRDPRRPPLPRAALGPHGLRGHRQRRPAARRAHARAVRLGERRQGDAARRLPAPAGATVASAWTPARGRGSRR